MKLLWTEFIHSVGNNCPYIIDVCIIGAIHKFSVKCHVLYRNKKCIAVQPL